jgi:hypothetical protein
MVRDGGRLYVECPNFAAPIARRSQLFHQAHIHNFTPKTLALLARRCGFRVERTLSAPDDPNLQVVLIGDQADGAALDATSYAATMQALGRAGAVRYHARWDYVRRRVVKLFSYLGEHAAAKRRVGELLARCRAFEKPIKLRINRAA